MLLYLVLFFKVKDDLVVVSQHSTSTNKIPKSRKKLLQGEKFPRIIFFQWESISPTFYQQLLRQFPFAQKLQAQTVSIKALQNTFVQKSCS